MPQMGTIPASAASQSSFANAQYCFRAEGEKARRAWEAKGRTKKEGEWRARAFGALRTSDATNTQEHVQSTHAEKVHTSDNCININITYGAVWSIDRLQDAFLKVGLWQRHHCILTEQA